MDIDYYRRQVAEIEGDIEEVTLMDADEACEMWQADSKAELLEVLGDELRKAQERYADALEEEERDGDPYEPEPLSAWKAWKEDCYVFG